MQVPPQFSAVHVDGRRAHQVARRGGTVAIEPRPVEVNRIEIVNYSFPELKLEIECGSGTYVRSIARDLGDALGCGGLMSALVRRAVGDFTIENAHSIDDIRTRPIEECLLPPLAAVAHLPRRLCTPADREELLCGRALFCPPESLPLTDSLFALVDDADQLLALAEHDPAEHRLRPRQVFLHQIDSPQ
jgi:tRNA pseudouridine55 synthase